MPHTCKLDSSDLEASRAKFASWVTTTAVQCRNNHELMHQLQDGLPAGFLSLIGTGSSRRTYSTPLGVVLKVQREDVITDPLREADLIQRGGDSYLPTLWRRRRMANLSEITLASLYPRLVARQYGFLGSFGHIQRHPSVIVAESATSLQSLLPDERVGISHRDMEVIDGFLQIYDPRVTNQRRTSALAADCPEGGHALENLGILASGHYAFLDASNFEAVSRLLNPWTACPTAFGWTFILDRGQTLAYSAQLFSFYQTMVEEKREELERKTHALDQTASVMPTP